MDEASGLRKNIDQPVVVGGVQQGTAEVASWNVKRVSFSCICLYHPLDCWRIVGGVMIFVPPQRGGEGLKYSISTAGFSEETSGEIQVHPLTQCAQTSGSISGSD